MASEAGNLSSVKAQVCVRNLSRYVCVLTWSRCDGAQFETRQEFDRDLAHTAGDSLHAFSALFTLILSKLLFMELTNSFRLFCVNQERRCPSGS